MPQAASPLSLSGAVALRPVLDQINTAFAQLSPTGEVLWVNLAFRELTGISLRELAGKFLSTCLQESSDSKADGHYHVTRKDGRVVWLHASQSVIRDPATQEPEYVLVHLADVTLAREAEEERSQLAKRLIESQEAERDRIARELHDDVGQMLALTRMRMERAGKPVSDVPGKLHPGPSELAKELDELAQKISNLSHQLHSPTLKYLGLERAVARLCREFRSQSKIEVDATFDQVPEKMDEMFGTAFFRVAQEALQNIKKHSKAKVVSVRLRAADGVLSLQVRDDGCGFDTDAAKLASGLGLISMRERLRLISGELDITSRPGEGTRVAARAPIPQTH